MCLAADKPLIESGTAGYLGQVTVIKKVSLKKRWNINFWSRKSYNDYHILRKNNLLLQHVVILNLTALPVGVYILLLHVNEHTGQKDFLHGWLSLL